MCDLELNFIAQVRTRAIENMVAIALTNYAPPDANGHSIAFTEKGSRDSLVIFVDCSQPSLLFSQSGCFHAILRAQFLHGRGKMIADGSL